MTNIQIIEGDHPRNEEIKGEEMHEVEFDTALKLTGFGKFHILVTLILGITNVAIVFEMLGISFVLPAARCDLLFNTSQQGLLEAINYIGMIFGSPFWGFLADTQGRKFVLIFTLILDCLVSLIGSLSVNIYMLIVARFLSGFFISCPSAVLFAFVGEFHSNKSRNLVVVLIGMSFYLGSIIMPGIAWLVIPLPIRFSIFGLIFTSWRLYMVVCALPCFFMVIIIYYLPESPKYLLGIDKHDEAIKILQRMYSCNTGKPPEEYQDEIREVLKDLSETINGITSLLIYLQTFSELTSFTQERFKTIGQRFLDKMTSIHIIEGDHPGNEENKRGEMQEVEFDTALKLTGFGKFHVLVTLILGITYIAVVLEMFGISLVLPAARCDLLFNTSQQGLLGAISFIGMIFGSPFWGFLADTQGRKFVLIFALILDCLVSLIGSLSVNIYMLIVARFLTGFFISCPSAVLFAFVGEFHSNRSRNLVVVMMGMFMNLGITIMPGIAWLVIPLPIRFSIFGLIFTSWRLYMVVCALPCFFMAIIIYYLPESPKYLLAIDKHDEAIKILQRIYSCNTGNPPEKYPVKSIMLDADEKAKIAKLSELQERSKKSESGKIIGILKQIWQQIIPLFLPPLWINTLLCCLLTFSIYLTENGLVLWMPEIYQRMGDYGIDSSVCEAMDLLIGGNNTTLECSSNLSNTVFWNVSLLGIGAGIGGVVAIGLVYFIGNNKSLVLGLCIVGFSGLSYLLANSLTAIVTLTTFYSGFCAVGMSVITSVVVDLFPTQLRGMAVSLAMMCARVGSVSGSVLIGLILDYYCNWIFYVFGGIGFSAMIISAFLPKPHYQSEEKK